MEKIQKITVNGTTYTVDDPDSVSFEHAQALTEEQKFQARENIGAAAIDDTKIGPDAWSGRNVVDTLCPAFSKSGAVVTCQPVKGYPLGVVTMLPESEQGYTGLTLYRGGKNLSPNVSKLDGFTSGSLRVTFIDNLLVLNGEGPTNAGFGYDADISFLLPPGTYTLSMTKLSGSGPTDASMAFGLRSVGGAWVPNSDGSYYGGSPTRIFTLTKTTRVAFSVVGKGTYDNLTFRIQVERGSAATEYEPYRGERFTADFGKTVCGGSYDWTKGLLTDETGAVARLAAQDVPAVSGENQLFSDTGDTAVTGRLDLITLLQQLAGQIERMDD